MNLPTLLTLPASVLLLKWTGLLALAWGAHGLLRHRDARWRLMLWRSVLGLGLLLPLAQFVDLPGVKIPVSAGMVGASHTPNSSSITGIETQTLQVKSESTPTKTSPPQPNPQRTTAIPLAPIAGVVSGHKILLTIWLLGCLWGITRLAWLQLTLTRLRNQAAAPTAKIEELAEQVRTALGVRRKIRIRVTDDIASPFVCDLLTPTIMVPQSLAQSLTTSELHALLNHEMAHIRQNDLAWCVAWQWLRAIGWFHPLVWRVPAAHNLACEQEADRTAAAQMTDRDSYGQLLARLALKVLSLPTVETQLTVNGSSQIAKRLNWLGQSRMARWNWRYSVAAFSMSLLLFLMVAGCETRKTPLNKAASAKVEFKQVLVQVLDDDGKPVEGATISPEGFRVKGIRAADAYSWRKDLFGPPEKVITDSAGQAYIKYPVIGIPEEKEATGKLFFSVIHPDYSTVRPQEYSVDTPEKPIRLTRGIRLKVSGYIGDDHQPVPELAPILNEEGIQADAWQNSDGHGYTFNKVSPGGHLLQLMGRLSSGQIVYSEVREFTAEKGKDYSFDLEMKPGIRLEGRLDDKTPRPVTNGRVIIGVRSKQFPAWTNWDQVADIVEKYPNVRDWKSYRPIAPDGSFVFESLPPGNLDVIVHGNGFASKNGGTFGRNFGVPQAFPLVAPTTQIEVATEPTATLEFTAKTKNGKPIADAWASLNPNVIRVNWGLFGDIGQSSEEPFNKPAPLPEVPYSTKTDKDGVAVIRNVPSCTSLLTVHHPQFQVPLPNRNGWRDRYVQLLFEAGATNRLTMVLEPKGTDFIGTAP